jgi:hypothetical protein
LKPKNYADPSRFSGTGSQYEAAVSPPFDQDWQQHRRLRFGLGRSHLSKDWDIATGESRRPFIDFRHFCGNKVTPAMLDCDWNEIVRTRIPLPSTGV